MSVRGERGFTLLETAVALLILSLAAVGALEAARRAATAQAGARTTLEVVGVAEWKMNELAALPTDSLAAYRDGRAGEVRLDGRRYRWRASATPRAGTPALWEVHVTVEAEGAALELRTARFRARAGGGVRP